MMRVDVNQIRKKSTFFDSPTSLCVASLCSYRRTLYLSSRMHTVTVLLLALVFICPIATYVQSMSTCGSLGHGNQIQYQVQPLIDNNDQLYLNTERPSTCAGNVTSWRYCYYTPTDPDSSYTVPFAVYRKIGLIYHRVSENIRIDISDVRDVNAGFVCGNISATNAKIERGDVIGACIHREGRDSISTLSLVGGANATGKLLTTNEGIDCDGGPGRTRFRYITPDTVSSSSLSEISSTILHLSAAEMIISPGQRNSNSTGAVLGSMFSILLLALIFVLVIVCIVYAVRHTDATQSSNSRTTEDSSTSDQRVRSNQSGFSNLNYNVQPSHHYHQLDLPSPVFTTPPRSQHRDHYEFARESGELIHSYDYAFGDTEVMPHTPHVVSYNVLLQKNQDEDIYSDLDPYQDPASEETEIYNQLKQYGINNIPRNNIQATGYLGSGQFGTVEHGLWTPQNGKEIPVALKSLKEKSSNENKIKFLQEAAIMAQFRHPNVIALYGVVCKGEPLILVVQLARKMDLKHYLESLRPDPGLLPSTDLPKLLLNCTQQVALGMQYLAGKGFVHRDLAARNILVSEKTVFKVADFGMSRDLADDTYYVAHGGKIPVKWTAPEALNYKKYSTASDVWSYGCLLYEIWSLGRKPFEDQTNTNAIHLIQIGYRLPPPPGCPRHIYELMIRCWHPDHSSRPLFREISLALLVKKDIVLQIPQEALETHNQAGVLGAPTEAGVKMYEDLQKTYLDPDQ